MNDIAKITTGIRPLDKNVMRDALGHQDRLLKPAGSLGRLEALAVQVAGITGRLHNEIDKKAHFLFASDHGIYDEGVSGSPQNFTRTLLDLYAENAGCGINVLCNHVGVDLKLVDMGVKESQPHPAVDRRFYLMPQGTNNFAIEPAMPPEIALKAIQAGIELAGEAKRDGYKILGTGEVGMANTTPAAACIMASLDIGDPGVAVGRGGGLTDDAFEKKQQVIVRALKTHTPNPSDPLDVLSKVGGLDIAGMTGVFLGAAYHRLPVVIDGVISVAAALLAFKAAPLAKEFMIPSHLSQEPGYGIAVRHMGLTPLLNLGMRLGEGSGCPIAMQVMEDALALMNVMNTFDGVSLQSEYRKNLKT